MWLDALLQAAADQQRLPYAMLRRAVLHTPNPYQRGTALLAHHALCSAPKPVNLHIWVPATDGVSARSAVSSLLLTDFFNQRFGGSRVNGDLLFITHAVGDNVQALCDLTLGDVKLSELWRIDSYSKYQPLESTGTQVIVSNPGWILKNGTVPDHIKGVVIDATHPRTLAHVPEIERACRTVPLRLVILPAMAEPETGTDGRQTWLWSPVAQREIAEALRHPCGQSFPDPKCHLLVVNDDPELDGALFELRTRLIALMKVMPRNSSIAMQPWGIYHRLRQLSVPLAQYEAAAKLAWGTTILKEQVAGLTTQELPDAALAGLWDAVAKAANECYGVMRKREEPAKLFATWQRIEEALDHNHHPLFITSASQIESDLLGRLLMGVSDRIREAVVAGDVEFIKAKDQARRIALGDWRKAIIPGYRHNLVHLDIYAPISPDVMLYPHEVPIMEATLDRTYGALGRLEEDASMGETLNALGFPKSQDSSTCRGTARPQPEIRDLNGKPVQLVQARPDAAELALEDLALYQASIREFTNDDGEGRRIAGSAVAATDHVILHFEEGPPLTITADQLMDIYYPATEELLRHEAEKVQVGMQLLHMVDDAYESLFDRVIDVLDGMASPRNRALLRLWREAKADLKQMHDGNVRELHRILTAKGLDADYSTLRTWLKDFDAADPQSYEHARIIAQHSGHYDDEDLIRSTFNAIDTERVRNRSAGRLLHSVLRAIVTGRGYKTALVDSRRLGAELSELFAAIELRTIVRIEIRRATHPSPLIGASHA